jgi:hypothetical protein
LARPGTMSRLDTLYPSPAGCSIYAHGIEEAPGHIALARAGYRQISREGNSFLEFALYLGIRSNGLDQSDYLDTTSTKQKALVDKSLNLPFKGRAISCGNARKSMRMIIAKKRKGRYSRRREMRIRIGL